MDTELSGRLFATVGRFRRQVRRSAGSPAIGAALPESQAELLRLVGRRPGISVREAAGELGLAPNTASTLVSKLSTDGMLLRTVDPDDRRIGRLRLSADAQRVADASRTARRAALGSALDRLDSTQIEDLTRGLDVLSELTRMLQEDKR